MTIIKIPGQKRSPNLTPPWLNAILLGGVEIMKGMPKDAETAIRIVVDGEGSMTAAIGIRSITVAVLLIKADKVALTRHIRNRLIFGPR